MTNKELIAKLKKLPPDAVVFVQAPDQSAHESEGEDFVKVSDVIDMLGNLKASQHQGEPIYQVKHLVSGDRGWIDVTKDRYEASQNHCWCTRIVYAEQPAPVAVVLPERLQQVLKFLDGAENLDGHWFGEPHPSGRPYWWRNELRKALTETNLFAKQQ